jgi:SAM-dependent methyltransferase
MSEGKRAASSQAAVRERYGRIARGEEACACTPSDCCSADHADLVQGLGCGTPALAARLQPGESVLDLGSGGGHDCLAAARRVGPSGRVVGIDMTPDMLERPRANARVAGFDHVAFRQGEIERLAFDDRSFDVVISNCVINLSTRKERAFAEAWRVLRPGGRLVFADTVATTARHEQGQTDLRRYTDCISGAVTVAEVERLLGAAGFAGISIRADTLASRAAPVAPALIEAHRPAVAASRWVNRGPCAQRMRPGGRSTVGP